MIMKRKLSDNTEENSDDDASDDESNNSGKDSDTDERDSVKDDDEVDIVKTESQPASAGAGNQSKESVEPARKVARLSKGDLYKPPTNEELNQLKETENLFHSTLFRMQISELLSEVSLKAKRRNEIENIVSTLKSSLTSLKKGEKYELQDYSWLDDLGIQVPFVMEPSKVKGSFQFIPPADVKLAGSFLSETCIKPNITVDLIVVMPKASFESKDFLNQRYLRKRALYLCKIAAELTSNPIVEEMKFSFLHGNHLKPILCITAKGEGRKSVKLHIHAVPEAGTFKLNRFHVEKNNVRTQWFQGLDDSESHPEKDVPTPFYNNSILEDLTESTLSETAEKILSSSPSVKEGIVLLKVWLRQRELDKGFGGFSGYIMTMFVCYLLSQNKLNRLMSSYQIFRNTLLKLSQSDWLENGICMCSVASDPNMPTLHEFHKYFDVVFVDPSGYFNMCYAVDRTVYKRICLEASLAMKILDDKGIDSFEKLFMKKVSFSLTFDHLFHVNLSSHVEEILEKLKLSDRVVDYGAPKSQVCLSALAVMLEKALGHRISLLQLALQEVPVWNVEEKPGSSETCEKLTYGLILNSEFAFNVLDRGPSADSVEAEDFRKFWGNKSELRRFQDGGICEAVLWLDKGNVAEKQLVCQHIIKYVLNRHANIKPENVLYIAGQLDGILHLPVTNTTKDPVVFGTGEEQGMALMHVYDDLCKMLRRLTDLPLTINSVQGTSPCFRYTEVFPPLPCTFRHRELSNIAHGVKRFVPAVDKTCPLYIHTLKVICTLEGSGKWPDDLEAMKRLKVAFHIQLADALKSTFNLPVKVGIGYIDVLKDHYVFRLVLAYNREIGMLKSVRSADGKLLTRDTEEALILERDTVALPHLTSILHGLQQQHPSFSTTTRLAKRWVSAHMLCDYIDSVTIELLVASLYISPAPNQVPSSGLCSFQRFLELLSTFDWKSTPLLINLNKEFTVGELAEIPAKFSKDRSTLPLMFISTPLDKYSSHWTKRGPSANILTRLVLLAAKSLEITRQQITFNDGPDLKQVFRPSLSIYDAVIHLNIQQLPRQQEGLEESHTIAFGKSVDEERFPLLEFDPPRLLLKELESTFGDLCLFFHDKHGGKVIGVLWKPSQLQPREFKVSHINYSKIDPENMAKSGGLLLEPNLDAVIEDFKIIGKGIISKIEVKENETFKC